MGEISIYGAQQVAKALIGQTGTIPGTWYIALINGDDPSGFITGAELDEPSGGGYARKAVTNNSTNWYELDYGKCANVSDLYFTTASASWGRIRSWALCDAATNGNIWFYGQFLSAKMVESGDTFWISNGAVQVEFLVGA